MSHKIHQHKVPFGNLPWYAVEHGHAKVCYGKVDEEVVGETPHPTVGQHGPKYQGVAKNRGDEDDPSLRM